MYMKMLLIPWWHAVTSGQLITFVFLLRMKLTYSSQDSLFHSESIYIGFKLTMPTVQELCPPQDGLHKQEWEKLRQNDI